MAGNTVNEETVIERKVKPVGNLLNDNDSGFDQLGYHVYSQALAKLLDNCNPPITVGIFGPWGIGKTFLLKHVQGLLRKCEQQRTYDEAAAGKNRLPERRNGGSSDEVDGHGKGDEPSIRPKNKTRRANSRRACTVHCVPLFACVVIVLLILAFAILLAISFTSDQRSTVKPVIISGNETGSGSRKVPQGRSAPLIPVIDNLTESYTETPTGRPSEIIISPSTRLFLLLFVFVLTGILCAGFCCCVMNTSSKSWKLFRANFKLVFYAAFTRLPSVAASPSGEWIEANNPDMVRHHNDEAAKLRYDPGEEENVAGARITSKQVRRMPSKYIFVNYQAWQYVGSDTLWAGIVTSLSEAIEKEFGAVCARLFRMIQVERPSKYGPIKMSTRGDDPRVVYVLFDSSGDCDRREKLLVIVKEYGVVTECCGIFDSWWYVRFSCDKEADYAEADLKLNGFEVRRIPPEKNVNNCDSSGRLTPATAEHDDDGSKMLRDKASSDGHKRKKKNSKNGDKIRMTMYPSHGRSKSNPTPRSGRDSVAMTHGEHQEKQDSCCSPCCGSCCLCCAHFRRHPKTVFCGCPFLYCCIIFVIAAIILPVTIMLLANHLELNVIKSNRAIPLEVQIFSWFPAMLGILVVAIRICWAMCHSQTERIRKALAGTKGNMANALGFMNDVKKEVMIMTQLINCVRFSHQIDYKVVITIDDLDRCPYEKVKSVLEAVNILLSDRSSPFICLIAVDSRIAVKCIEQDMGEVMLQAHVTGHEYLKKIVNLPFCLPEVSNNRKRKYFGGIIDISDQAEIVRTHGRRSGVEATRAAGRRVTEDMTDAVFDDDRPGFISQGANGTTQLDGNGETEMDLAPRERQPPTPEQQFDDFLFRCRQIINGEGEAGHFVHQHLCGNPRNMKRIFNVMSLTTHLMKCLEEQRIRRHLLEMHSKGTRGGLGSEHHHRRQPVFNSDLRSVISDVNMAVDLVKWIVAADQWPYRISYILQVIEDSDQRRAAGIDEPKIDNDCTLSKVYETFVEAEIAKDTESSSMLTLDHDPAVLRSFLRGSPSLTRQKISQLFPVTLNLDQSLRNGISRQRAMPKSSAKVEGETPASDERSEKSESDDGHSGTE